MIVNVPYLTYRDVGRYVERFLEKFHPSLKLPIPIEGIIEFDLNLHIISIPNLYRTFSQSGFLSADRTKIFIDEYQYDNFIEKYRFTPAHEIGHFIMHKSFYEGLSFRTHQEYIEFLESMPQRELYWYETQGDWFAGQLLVPTSQLEKYCVELLESNRDKFSSDEEVSHEFWSYASNELCEPFEVNPVVIEIRIQKESFAEKLKDYYKQK